MLATFRPLTKTKLMQSFCLISLYGSSLWKACSAELRSLEVAFYNLLRKIWNLPLRCHTGILHCVNNVVIDRCSKLVISAKKAGSQLLTDVFDEATTLVYTSAGPRLSATVQRNYVPSSSGT